MLRPVNNRLIAKIVAMENQKNGSLFLPHDKPKKDTFEVIATNDNEHGIKAGDTILANPYDAKEMQMDGNTFYFIFHDAVIGVFEHE